MDANPDLLLGQLAVKNGFISASDLASAQEIQTVQARRGSVKSVGRILVEMRKLTETQLSQLESGQRFAAARQEAQRFGELAIRGGLATLQQVEAALARQKQAFQGGRGSVVRVGEILVEMRVLTRDAVDGLLAQQQTARSGSAARPRPAPAPHPQLPPAPRSRLWIAPTAAAVVIVAAIGLFLGLRSRSATNDRARMAREMESSMERGRSAVSRGEVPEAIEAYEKASSHARAVIEEAERTGGDTTSAKAVLWEADAKVDLLRASARWMNQVQDAVQAARKSEDATDAAAALSAVERAIAVIADYEEAVPKDDPNRPQVSRWLSELASSKDRLAEKNVGAEARAKADAHYKEAKAAMDRVVARAGDAATPGKDPSQDALLVAIREAASACEAFESAAEPDDARRPEVDGLQKRLDDLQASRLGEFSSPGAPGRTHGRATTAQELAKSASPSVVYVCVRTRRGTEESWGSGFIVDARGYVVTNRHVVTGAESIRVGWDDSVTRPALDASLVAWSVDQDLALLKLPLGEYPALDLASAAPALGQRVVAIGFPIVGDMKRHPGLTLNEGIVSSVGRQIEGLRDLLETDAVLTPGNSGGPIFEVDGGSVLGVAVAAFQGPLHGRNLGIPVSWVRSEFPGLSTTRGYESAIPPPTAESGHRGGVVPDQAPAEDARLKAIQDRARRDLGTFTKSFDQGRIWPAGWGGRAGKSVKVGNTVVYNALDAWKLGLRSIESGEVDLGIELLGVSGSWYRESAEMRDALLVDSTYARLKVLRSCFAATSRGEALAAVRACREQVVSLLGELSDLKHAMADPEKRWTSTPQTLKDVEDQLNTTKRLCTDLGVP